MRPPNPRARGVETLATDRAANRADREQIRRSITDPPAPPLVKIARAPAQAWPPGTAWLDTSGE